MILLIHFPQSRSRDFKRYDTPVPPYLCSAWPGCRGTGLNCIARHQVFAGLAQRGKNSMGGFFGFKLHRTVNARGELRAFALTPATGTTASPSPD